MRGLIGSIIDRLEDCEVTEVASGFEALRLLPRETFALIITDINMPDINGLELIRFTRAHARYAKTPLIIISTEGRDVDREKAMALGANDYLVKPFTPEALVAAVRRHLAKG